MPSSVCLRLSNGRRTFIILSQESMVRRTSLPSMYTWTRLHHTSIAFFCQSRTASLPSKKSSQVPTIGNIVNVHRNFMTSWRWSMSLGDWCVERAKRRLGNDTDLRRNTASTCPRNVLQRKRNWTTLTRLYATFGWK